MAFAQRVPGALRDTELCPGTLSQGEGIDQAAHAPRFARQHPRFIHLSTGRMADVVGSTRGLEPASFVPSREGVKHPDGLVVVLDALSVTESVLITLDPGWARAMLAVLFGDCASVTCTNNASAVTVKTAFNAQKSIRFFAPRCLIRALKTPQHRV